MEMDKGKYTNTQHSMGGWIKAAVAAERRYNCLRIENIFARAQGRDLLQEPTQRLPGCVNLNAAASAVSVASIGVHTPLFHFLVNI